MFSYSAVALFCNSMDCSPPGPLSMRFPRQEYWSGLPFLSLEDLPDPRIEPPSPVLTGGFSPLAETFLPLDNSSSFLLPLQPLIISNYLSVFMNLINYLFPIIGIIQCLFFCVWFSSVSIKLSRFIHVVAYIRIHSFPQLNSFSLYGEKTLV